MSVSEATYNTPVPEGKGRTLSFLIANSSFARNGCKKHKGSINEPILPIEPSQLVIDELHLLLRVSDVLLRNLIFQADTIDHRSRERSRTERGAVRSLEELIRSCGVSFEIRRVSHESIHIKL